jgi:chaperone required for assembly of F1-ATPase
VSREEIEKQRHAPTSKRELKHRQISKDPIHSCEPTKLEDGISGSWTQSMTVQAPVHGKFIVQMDGTSFPSPANALFQAATEWKQDIAVPLGWLSMNQLH